jgi:hypothetical protein
MCGNASSVNSNEVAGQRDGQISPWQITKRALIPNRRTFDDIENCDTSDPILSFKKQRNCPNADRSTQAVSNQLCQISMQSHKQNRIIVHTKSDGLVAGSGNTVAKRLM